MLWTSSDFSRMPGRHRATLINCLSGFKSANLVGTRDTEGNTNLAMISSAFHLGADPALLGFISRPDLVSRHTLENIRDTSVYTLNHVHSGIIAAAHQTSARYPREQSEFDATGLTPTFSQYHDAPYVAECRVRLGLVLREMIDIVLNGTVLVIGEVVELHLPDNAVGEDGFVDLAALGTVSVSGLDSYSNPQPGQRYRYAKPGIKPGLLD